MCLLTGFKGDHFKHTNTQIGEAYVLRLHIHAQDARK